MAMGKSTVETRFGTLQTDTADVITMVDPVPGFESCQRYVVVSAADLAPFVCLQGLEGTRPSFLAVDPRRVVAGYDVSIGEAERRRLAAADSDPLLWLSIARVTPEGIATVNLRAPFVVNPARMTALQLLAADRAYAIDHPLE